MANITKKIIVEEVAKAAKEPKTKTRMMWETFATIIMEHMGKGDKVNIDGFGTFLIQEVDDRQHRNPQTGETIIVKAHNIPKFKPAKDMKLAVNKE